MGIDKHPDKAFTDISDLDFSGKWKVYFFWHADFTFVCPTEIAGFATLAKQFQARDTQILGGSTDSEWVHRAWRNDHPDRKHLPFPMLADVRHELCEQLGILGPNGMVQRAAYIVDPEGAIRFAYVTDGDVGRNPEEVLRVLDALQPSSFAPAIGRRGRILCSSPNRELAGWGRFSVTETRSFALRSCESQALGEFSRFNPEDGNDFN